VAPARAWAVWMALQSGLAAPPQRATRAWLTVYLSAASGQCCGSIRIAQIDHGLDRPRRGRHARRPRARLYALGPGVVRSAISRAGPGSSWKAGRHRGPREHRGGHESLPGRQPVLPGVHAAAGAAERGKKRLRALCRWHFPAGRLGYWRGCRGDGLPCARGERGADGRLCPYREQASISQQEHEAWDVLLACRGQLRLAPDGHLAGIDSGAALRFAAPRGCDLAAVPSCWRRPRPAWTRRWAARPRDRSRGPPASNMDRH
jgi:hypothetical protein